MKKTVFIVLILLLFTVPPYAEDVNNFSYSYAGFVFLDGNDEISIKYIREEGEKKDFVFHSLSCDLRLGDILTRCREFIDNYSEPLYSIDPQILIWSNPSRYVYLNGEDEAEIQLIQNRIDKRKRERQLRQDIETIIEILTEIGR